MLGLHQCGLNKSTIDEGLHGHGGMVVSVSPVPVTRYVLPVGSDAIVVLLDCTSSDGPWG